MVALSPKRIAAITKVTFMAIGFIVSAYDVGGAYTFTADNFTDDTG